MSRKCKKNKVQNESYSWGRWAFKTAKISS